MGAAVGNLRICFWLLLKDTEDSRCFLILWLHDCRWIPWEGPGGGTSIPGGYEEGSCLRGALLALTPMDRAILSTRGRVDTPCPTGCGRQGRAHLLGARDDGLGQPCSHYGSGCRRSRSFYGSALPRMEDQWDTESCGGCISMEQLGEHS